MGEQNTEIEPWLAEIIDKAHTLYLDQNTVRFKINKILEHGFMVRTCGLYAFIHFDKMPWYYKDNQTWSLIFPELFQKGFYAKIERFENSPLRMYLNAWCTKFKEYKLVPLETYESIIIQKTKNIVEVELGGHFDWKSGSIKGTVHKSQFDSYGVFKSAKPGDSLSVVFIKERMEGPPSFSTNKENAHWALYPPQDLIGRVVEVTVIKNEDSISLIVLDRYIGRLIMTKKYHSQGAKKYIKGRLKSFDNLDTFNAEIIGLDKSYNTLQLVWRDETNPRYRRFNNKMSSLVDDDVLKELNSFG